MKFLTIIFVILFATFKCLGNQNNENFVARIDSLIKELNESNDSIGRLKFELAQIKSDLEKVKTRSEAFDESVWEYGSSLTGIVVGLIVLFGVIYFVAATNAAKGVFETNFQSYVDRLSKITDDAEFAKKRLQFNYKSFEDVYSDKDEFNKSLNDEYENGDTRES